MTIDGKLEKFASYLIAAGSVALLCHINPDSDTLGSALSLRLALNKLGKKCFVFCDDNVPVKLGFLPTSECLNIDTDIKNFDVCSAIDCSDATRFNLSGKYFKHAKVTLMLDHHKTTDLAADYTLSAPEAAATAELVYKLIRILECEYKKELIDNDIATLLYAAIVGDTGGFSFDNVTGNTFETAGALLNYGVDGREIIYKMIKAQPVCRYKLKGRAMDRTRFFEDEKIGILTFTLKDFEDADASSDYTEGIINELIDVTPVLVAFSVSEAYANQYKVSIRTKAPYDATEISGVFGGGGHARAAGCRISGFYEDIIDKLVKSARDLIDA